MIIDEKWIEEMKEDTNFDFNNIESNFGIAKRMAKWLERKQILLSKYINLLKKKKEIERKLFEYYKTDFDIVVNTREELKLLINTDPEFRKVDDELMILEKQINFVDKVLDMLKTKVWEIKYYLEWKKFKEGV